MISEQKKRHSRRAHQFTPIFCRVWLSAARYLSNGTGLTSITSNFWRSWSYDILYSAAEMTSTYVVRLVAGTKAEVLRLEHDGTEDSLVLSGLKWLLHSILFAPRGNLLPPAEADRASPR